MRVTEILRHKGADVVAVPPDETIRNLVRILNEHNIGAVIVSTGDRRVDGIVSERDVIRRLGEGPDVLDDPVQTIMTAASELHTCTAADGVDQLMHLMTEHRVRHVPVLDDDGLLAGIVSIGDVVKNRISELQFERDELEHYVTT
jgi:CBS domain-containing protein